MPVYYVVQKGYHPSVYIDKKEAESQLVQHGGAKAYWFTNFNSAVFWNTLVRDRRPPYFDDEKIIGDLGLQNPSADQKCYVVFEGRVPGLYYSFADYEDQVKGYRNATGKAYPNFEAAAIAYREYMKSLSFSEIQGRVAAEEFLNNQRKSEKSAKRRANFDETTVAKKVKKSTDRVPEKTPIVVYTDGCCLRNGKTGARAGLGLYYGLNDPRNAAKPLQGALQTNQRAELAAVLQALDDNPSQPMTICTDSHYAINCVNVWSKKWESNGYKNSRGKPVENEDLVRRILILIGKRRAANIDTEFQHVSGHSGVEGNEAADRLAKEGAEKVSVE